MLFIHFSPSAVRCPHQPFTVSHSPYLRIPMHVALLEKQMKQVNFDWKNAPKVLLKLHFSNSWYFVKLVKGLDNILNI